MNMVRHQNIRMNLATMLVAGQLQFFKIKLIIRIGAEYLTAIVAPHNDMLDLTINDSDPIDPVWRHCDCRIAPTESSPAQRNDGPKSCRC